MWETALIVGSGATLVLVIRVLVFWLDKRWCS